MVQVIYMVFVGDTFTPLRGRVRPHREDMYGGCFRVGGRCGASRVPKHRYLQSFYTSGSKNHCK